MIILVDLEGTLVDGEFLIKLADKNEKKDDVQEITKKGLSNEISWTEGLKKRINILDGCKYCDIIETTNELEYTRGINDFCNRAKDHSDILIGVTGGFKIFASKVKRDLGLDYIISNELLLGKKGELRGVKRINVSENNIDELDELLNDFRGDHDKIIAIGDGANNIELFKYSDYSIAFNAQDIVKEEANFVVEEKDLNKVYDIIENKIRG